MTDARDVGLRRLLHRAAMGLLGLSLRHPLGVFAAWLLLAAVALPGVMRLHVDTSTKSVLQHGDEAWDYYQRSLELFGGDEVVVVALEGERPFDPELLARVDELSAALRQIEGVRRVDSLATVPFLRATPDGALDMAPAISDDVLASRARQREMGRRLLEEDRVSPRLLVSDDGRTLAVNVILESADVDYQRIVTEIRRSVVGLEAWVSGVPVFRSDTNLRTVDEIARFIPLTLLALACVLWIAFSSWRAVAIPLISAGFGTWMLAGALGAFGVPFTLATSMLPSVVLALGCSYAMHLLTAAQGARPGSLQELLAPVALPVSLSGLTTAIGFLAMSVVRIDAVREAAVFGALGVLTVMLATLSLVPAALARWPLGEPRHRTVERIREVWAPQVLGAAVDRPRLMVALWGGLLVAVVFGLQDLRVETDVTRWFQTDTPVRKAYEGIRERLSGISPMNVVIESTNGQPVTGPEVLERIQAFQDHLASRPRMGRVLSLADPLGQLHVGFTGGQDGSLPDRQDLAEQYLLLLESMEEIGDVVTDSRSATNLLLRLDDNGSRHLLDVAAEAEAWWRAHGAPGFEARTTGVMYEFARASDEIAWGQIRGLSLALLAIAGILLAIFRSPRIVAVALVPNAVPVLVAFGSMGLLGIALDAGTVFIGNLALGIAVDDTMHFVNAYYEERAPGRGRVERLAAAMRRVLPAITYTTLAVTLGFLVLGLSDFTFIRNLGLVTGAVMVLCLAADVNLLPALLRAQELGLRRRGGRLRPGPSGQEVVRARR